MTNWKRRAPALFGALLVSATLASIATRNPSEPSEPLPASATGSSTATATQPAAPCAPAEGFYDADKEPTAGCRHVFVAGARAAKQECGSERKRTLVRRAGHGEVIVIRCPLAGT
jgi:hypothetical protein